MGRRGLKGIGSDPMTALLADRGSPESQEDRHERDHPSRRRPVEGSKVMEDEHQRSSIPVFLASARQSQGPRQHARSVDSMDGDLRPILLRSTTRASRALAAAELRDSNGTRPNLSQPDWEATFLRQSPRSDLLRCTGYLLLH